MSSTTFIMGTPHSTLYTAHHAYWNTAHPWSLKHTLIQCGTEPAMVRATPSTQLLRPGYSSRSKTCLPLRSSMKAVDQILLARCMIQMPGDEHDSLREAALDSHSLSLSDHELPSSGLLPVRLLAVMRILVATEAELEELTQSEAALKVRSSASSTCVKQ
jgi:hypothetical protein